MVTRAGSVGGVVLNEPIDGVSCATVNLNRKGRA